MSRSGMDTHRGGRVRCCCNLAHVLLLALIQTEIRSSPRMSCNSYGQMVVVATAVGMVIISLHRKIRTVNGIQALRVTSS